MISPFSKSTAQPTLKWEYGAYAFSLAFLDASKSCLSISDKSSNAIWENLIFNSFSIIKKSESKDTNFF